MFWDSLDLTKDWRNIFKILLIRYALILTHVHLKKHPDEIHQGKEITYKILYGQNKNNMGGI